MKKIFIYIMRVLYTIYSPQTKLKLIYFRDKLYTYYLSNSISKIGDHLLIMKPITLVGGSRIEIGRNVVIGRYSILTAFTKRMHQTFAPIIKIGDSCNFGEYNHITCINQITIGKGVLTGRWVTITDNSHGESTLSDLNIEPKKRDVISKGPVVINDDVWIGDKVTVLPNVNIGKGSIIAANSVVTKNIPPYCVAAGSPAKVIKNLRS